MIGCPRCGQKVAMRELAEHQRGSSCLALSSAGMQTLELETSEQGSQCVVASLPVAVQTSYAFALLAPELSVEPLVASLQPSVAIRWKPPPPQVRQVVTEYQLTVSEGGCGAPGP